MIGDVCSADWLSQRLCIAFCTDSSTASRTGNGAADSDASLLVLDCRSPDEYAECHVIGSHCVAVPSIVLRRMRSGTFPASATNAIGMLSRDDESNAGGSCTSGLRNLADRCRRTDFVVLYDSGLAEAVNNDGSDVRPYTEVQPSLTSLADVMFQRLTAEGCRVYRLQGGFTAFKSRFGHMCVGSHTKKETPANTSILNLSSLCLSPSPMTPPTASFSSASVSPSSEIMPSPAARDSYSEGVIAGNESRACSQSLCYRPQHQQHPFPVEVLPYLYLGDAENSRDFDCLCRHDIRYIVNVTADVPNTFADRPGFRYLRIPINDHWSENVTSFFNRAITFIDEARSSKSGVLIHCLAGISRSVTVTVAYLMSSAKLSLDDAYDYLRRCRPNIAPNISFMGQLMDFEQVLRDSAPDASCPRCHDLRVASDLPAPGDVPRWTSPGCIPQPTAWSSSEIGHQGSVERHCRHARSYFSSAAVHCNGDDVTLFMTTT